MLIQVAVLLAVLFTAGPAMAHAHLRSASPDASSVGPAPSALSLGFSEAIEPLLSRITVIGPDGDVEADAASLVPPDDQRRMVLRLPVLPPGIHTVKWVIVSIDTHRTGGSYRFTVAP
jgi:methionine-rich copper-binding protein CopC